MIRVIGLLFASALASISIAHASEGTVGNGGDVVYCPSGAPFTARLLDHYEAKFFDPSWALDLGAPSLTVEQKVELALSRLALKDQSRSNLYSSYWQTFFADTAFTNDELVDIPDSGHISKPAGCEVRQVAIQFADDNLFQGKKYLINNALWGMLDNDGKAALVLHELIYRDALRSGHTNSISTRKFNSLISQSTFESIDQAAYHQFITDHAFSFVSNQPGVLLESEHTVYMAPGVPNVGRVAKGSFLDFGNGRLPISLPKNPERQGKTLALFYPNGQIESVCHRVGSLDHPYHMEFDNVPYDKPYVERQTLFTYEFQGVSRPVSCIRFAQSGEVNYLRFALPQAIQVGAHSLTNVMEVSLGENQAIKDIFLIGALASPQFISEYGQNIRLADRVRFFPNGKFRSGGSASMAIVVENQAVSIKAFEFFENGLVRSAVAKAPFTGRLANGQLVNLSGGEVAFVNSHLVEFNADGKIVKGTLAYGQEVLASSPAGELKIAGNFWLYDNGSVRLAYMNGDFGKEFTILGQPAKCRIVGFHESGAFSACFYNLHTDQANFFPFAVNGQALKVKGMIFHDNGQIRLLDFAFHDQEDGLASRLKTEIQGKTLFLWEPYFDSAAQLKVMGYFNSAALVEKEKRVNSFSTLRGVGISHAHEFYPNGKLKYGTVAEGSGPLMRTDGQLEQNPGEGLAFDENGLLYFSSEDFHKL